MSEVNCMLGLDRIFLAMYPSWTRKANREEKNHVRMSFKRRKYGKNSERIGQVSKRGVCQK